MGLKNKIKESLKGKISIKEFAFICLFSILYAFNFYIFNQFDVMLHNQAEFGVNITEVIWLFVWRALVIMFALIAALTILRCHSKKKFTYTVAILFGLIIAGYAQVLFMNKEKLMTVRGTMRAESVLQFILNSVLYLGILFTPLAIVKSEMKKNKNVTKKLAPAVCVVILGMQIMGISSVGVTSPKPAKDNELYYFSVEEQLKLSKKDNIIIFVLDRFDTTIADTIFKRNPETKDIFSGATYYQNNISEYPGTFPSVPAMLTNNTFDKKTGKQIEYLETAWKDEILFSALHENNYKVNGLLDSTASFYDFKDLNGKIDNIKKIKKDNRKIRGNDFFSAMLSYAQIRQSPDALKDIFTNDRHYEIASYCVKINNTPDYFPRSISASSDLVFYNNLKKKGLTANEEKNVFSFVHLQASHSPHRYNENLQLVRKYSKSEFEMSIAQTRGAFKILDEYFSQMKKLGIYDNSTIIVLGDHGIWNNTNELVRAPTTSLIIKEKGDSSSALQIDNTAQLSNHNLHATILELIGANEKKTTLSYFDVLKNNGIQTRYFYYVRWTNLNSCVYICAYKVTGDASKVENWEKID